MRVGNVPLWRFACLDSRCKSSRRRAHIRNGRHGPARPRRTRRTRRASRSRRTCRRCRSAARSQRRRRRQGSWSTGSSMCSPARSCANGCRPTVRQAARLHARQEDTPSRQEDLTSSDRFDREAEAPRTARDRRPACAFRPVRAPTASADRTGCRQCACASASPASGAVVRSTSMRMRVVASPSSAQPSVMPRPKEEETRKETGAPCSTVSPPSAIGFRLAPAIVRGERQALSQSKASGSSVIWPRRRLPRPQSVQSKVRSNSTRGRGGIEAQDLVDGPARRIDPCTDDMRCRRRRRPVSSRHHSRSVILCSPGASKTQSPVYQSACSAMSSKWPCGRPPMVARSWPAKRRAWIARPRRRSRRANRDGVSISMWRVSTCSASCHRRRDAGRRRPSGFGRLQARAKRGPARLGDVGAEIAGPQIAKLFPVGLTRLAPATCRDRCVRRPR